MFIWVTLLLAGWLSLLRLHLALTNEKGSPEPSSPFEVANPHIAQAIYGRLTPDHEADYYSFEAAQEAKVRALLLIPASAYSKGLRAAFKLEGPGLPTEGITPPIMHSSMTIIGREYLLVQTHPAQLPVTGRYRVTVERQEGEGVYVFCVGDQEGGKADALTREKVEALLDR